ncbi:hypothetical protein KQX54_021211 [Cotesia glomerata]|uniref:Secreted protein n=1 Tax=Cotesia glomerata TaxID=32391 RepID=A0AAV7I5F7_COTGL|nr:hypothetical protein KQX54_021211 [Cotesia glomerata]
MCVGRIGLSTLVLFGFSLKLEQPVVSLIQENEQRRGKCIVHRFLTRIMDTVRLIVYANSDASSTLHSYSSVKCARVSTEPREHTYTCT